MRCVLRVAASCPRECVVAKQCKWISVGDITGLSKTALRKDAEKGGDKQKIADACLEILKASRATLQNIFGPPVTRKCKFFADVMC